MSASDEPAWVSDSAIVPENRPASIGLRKASICSSRAELGQQVGVGDGQHEVAGRADVGRGEPGEGGFCHGGRQLRAAEALVHPHADQVGLGKGVPSLLDLADDGDRFSVETRLVRVALLVVRREVPGRQLLAQIEDAVEGFAGVFGEPLPFRQLVDAQPFIEQKVEIAPRQQSGLHPSIFAETAGRSREGSIRTRAMVADIVHSGGAGTNRVAHYSCLLRRRLKRFDLHDLENG